MSKILELAKRIASTGGLETKTTETISGTYDSAGQQRLLSHAYTIGANLTITNGELILSRLADNGTGMTVEFGSDVTLSGDGTLMLGDLGQGQPNQDFSASRITGKLPSTVFPAGHVLQVLTDVKTDAYETGTSAGTFYNPSGLSVAITPVSTSSKILVMCSLFIGTSSTYELACKIQKTIGASTSDVLVGEVSGSVTRAMFTRRLSGARDSSSSTMVVLDSPNTTSEITYKPAITVEGGVTIYLNKTQGQADVNHDYNGASQITVMEIAG
jgi:hypothetical protein